MWLERFSGQSAQSTPGGGTPNRAFSPAPRRSIQLGPNTLSRRPGLTPRTSSLGALAGTGSTDSLPSAARIANGTNLRRELNDSPAPDVRDPLKTLHKIVGVSLDRLEDQDESRNLSFSAEELVEDVDFQGLSLQEFADARTEAATSQAVHDQSIPVVEDFEKEKDKFEDLHQSISECDGILHSVETYLASFRADLAAVSSEIETLQYRSTSLNTRLQNRKVVEKTLCPEVEVFSLAPAIVRKITEGNIDDAWVKALEELEKRSRSIDVSIKEGRDVKAAQDMRPFVDDISNKAVERIRDYVVAQIKALRSPSINSQIIQQSSFVRYRGLLAFLAQRQPELANEISQAYVNTMRWYFLSNFTRYKTVLEKLKLHVIETSETVGTTAAPRQAARTSPPHDALSLGRRVDILQPSADAALSSSVAEESKDHHYLEVPFRAFNLALMDNASAEYSFLVEFFYKQPLNVTTRRFNAIIQQTFELGQAFTRQLIEQSQDAIGVLLCVRLNQRFAFELQRRKVPALEGYVNATNMLLWPRFQILIDAHRESVRKLTASLPGKPVGSALSLTASSNTSATTAPHPLTQRFANFVQAILSLSSKAGDDEPVANSLGRLRNEFEAFLIKLGKGFSDARKRDRSLYNNYSLVCTVIAETEGKMADDFRERFTGLREELRLDI